MRMSIYLHGAVTWALPWTVALAAMDGNVFWAAYSLILFAFMFVNGIRQIAKGEAA